MDKTRTRGNVIVEDIEVGDIHYEFDYGFCIKSEVLTKPVYDEKDEMWRWKSKSLSDGRIIDYGVNPKYSHYSSKLYDYEAYIGCRMI